MKKFYVLLVAAVCLFLAACGVVSEGLLFTPSVNDRTNAVVDIENIERSTTEVTSATDVTVPRYFEVVAASTTASSTETQKPIEKEPTPVPVEYYMVKFVDYDGYSMISVQNVAEGSSAVEPPMPEQRGDLIFRGWDKDFSNVKQSMIVKAIYQKEWLTVHFYDANGTLLKTEQVSYGEDATPPNVTAPDGYIFDGWSRSYEDVTRDLSVYASYTASPKSKAITLIDAYKVLTVTENTLGLPITSYYRTVHSGVCTINGEDYAGNIIYGNFSDTLELSGYGFTVLEGSLGLKTQQSNVNNTKYELQLYIYVDDELKVNKKITKTGTIKDFSVDLTGAKTVTIRLEPYVDGDLYYIEPEFFGGIIDAIIY